jgi:hypothetical protein
LEVFALEDRRQRGAEVVDQLVHRGLEFAGTAGWKLNGDWPIWIDKIVDVNPIRRIWL